MWIEQMQTQIQRAEGNWAESFGEVKRMQGQILVSKGPLCSVGDICTIGERRMKYEVVALEEEYVHLLPLVVGAKIRVGDRVYREIEDQITLPPHEHLMGKVMNGIGEFLDEEVEDARDRTREKRVSITRVAPPAMKRRRIAKPLMTGIKAIDGMLTIGEGQRMGIFAGSGVGKSTLLGMLAKTSEADVNVIALIGERGREVREFIEESLGEDGMARSVVVVATGDDLPLMRIKAAQLATTIAEMFRDDGKQVLLVMDSVTRFMFAVKDVDIEIGKLEMGGRTPSMESTTQQLMERTGMGETGSITALYTILVSEDDMNGTVADIARGILDGHIILDRKLARINHYPAIDVLSSKSRVMEFVVSESHLRASEYALKCLGLYEEYKDMIQFGEYKKGRNLELDEAIFFQPKIQEFLRQGRNEGVPFLETVQQLESFRA